MAEIEGISAELDQLKAEIQHLAATSLEMALQYEGHGFDELCEFLKTEGAVLVKVIDCVTMMQKLERGCARAYAADVARLEAKAALLTRSLSVLARD